ncbi:aryl-alcohol-oxidase from pleurotus Eryingii [Schizopora paradoxa]|uniref:Aryl-alcohol-oxidase from pleurotus Eryingii n=1 Tax=Schizopora paradoxa TaxID=27342 RepID=A0A0H2S4L4_9AGAM|nr:aryl-alcohol-oxidase from pleurotus Eryingii [Schizopora paradoxa]
MPRRSIVLVLAALAKAVSSALFTDVGQLSKTEYDFVIVGAGAAGNVLASRLTESKEFSVLVIEAGVTDQGVLGIEVPFLAPTNQPMTAVTWNFTTTPQTSLAGRVLNYPRGRVLGGSSSINFLTYTRGSNEEYDRWAELTGDSGWAWDNVAQFYFKSSRLVPPVDGHSTAGDFNPADHGNGPIEVSLPGMPTEIDNRVINTSKQSGSEFPFNIDLQSGNAVGVGLAQSTIGGGARSSSSTAYLTPVLNRTNLDVLIQTTVTRLISSGSSENPIFRTVEVAANASSKRSTVSAKKEVILSAGSIGTPQILMLSGIGDQTALKKLGIKTLLNLPDVGQNLQDHPIMSNYFLVNSNNTFDDVLRNTSILDADLAQWTNNRTGLFGNAPGNAVAFLRLPNNAAIFKQFKDPSAGPQSAHFEFIFADGFAATVQPQPATGHFLTINSAVVSPISKGSVTLNSTNPFEFPIINPNFFSSPFDQAVMLQAVKTARSFVAASPWAGFVQSRFGPVGDAETDDEIIAASKQSIVTIFHPVCTARMSPKDASWGVVDPQLLVKGATGLRIVDASIFPIIPAAHTVGPTYIVAERAAQLIKDAWS